MSGKSDYYIPKPSHWPILAAIALFSILVGVANWLHENAFGPYLFLAGTFLFIFMLVGWFAQVIKENQAGLLDTEQMERTYRWAMFWFIFSEVAFFCNFLWRSILCTRHLCP